MNQSEQHTESGATLPDHRYPLVAFALHVDCPASGELFGQDLGCWLDADSAQSKIVADSFLRFAGNREYDCCRNTGTVFSTCAVEQEGLVLVVPDMLQYHFPCFLMRDQHIHVHLRQLAVKSGGIHISKPILDARWNIFRFRSRPESSSLSSLLQQPVPHL